VFFSPKQCTYKIIPDILHIIQITRPIDLSTAENPHPHQFSEFCHVSANNGMFLNLLPVLLCRSMLTV
jgi:hypothetical protein